MFEAYGAKPMPTPFKEALDDLKNGSVDGAENALQQIYTAHWNEATKYLTISNHLYSPVFVLVNEEHFSKLPKDVQQGLTQIAVDLEPWDRKMGAKLDRETLAKMRGHIKINEIDLMEFFHTAAVGIYDEFARKVPNGEKLIDRIDALAHPEPQTSSSHQ
jgi:TRAP-type C4-dicarboxylate transport system substrate-binding protein